MVYFIQGVLSKKIKIGQTKKCPLIYMRGTVQARSGEGVVLLGVLPRVTDREVQDLFRSDWSHGEWFYSTDRLMAYIEKAENHKCAQCPQSSTTLSPWDRQRGNKGKTMRAEQKQRVRSTMMEQNRLSRDAWAVEKSMIPPLTDWGVKW